jgi:hypothetical protein
MSRVANADSYQVGTGHLAAIYQATVTLTDAQIKALPTTPITVVPAAGAATIMSPIGGMWTANFTAGAYTNIKAAAVIAIKCADGARASAFLPNDITITGATADLATQLLGHAGRTFINLAPYFEADLSGSWGVLPSYNVGSGINSALQVEIDNSGSGNLTGGNSANLLRITLFYAVVPIP